MQNLFPSLERDPGLVPHPPMIQVGEGEVWIVGAGPGHPGLITRLGWEVLLQADVVVHDRLGCEELLQELPRTIQRVNVGKGSGTAGPKQSEINDLLVELARQDIRVVRLKGGDPFVFGRGMEEVLHLREKGISCHLVPGVTSAFAGPAAAGVTVTHRGMAHSVTVRTGRGEEEVVPEHGAADTLVYLMALGALEEVVRQLIGEGMPPGIPAVVVSHATTYRQQSVRATLGTIAERVAQEGLRPPGVLVIGETVGLAEEAPKGRGQVMVVTSTRIPPVLSERYPERQLLWRPLVGVESLEGSARLRSQGILRHSPEVDWILFSNPHAVRGFLAGLRESGGDVRRITSRLAAVGRETGSALEAYALRADLVVHEGGREGLIQRLGAALAGSRILFPCVEDYPGTLPEELEAVGVRGVVRVPVFRQVGLNPAPVDWSFVDSVFFVSPFAVRRFGEVWPDVSRKDLAAWCLGESTARRAAGLGFGEVVNLAASPGGNGDPVSMRLFELEAALA